MPENPIERYLTDMGEVRRTRANVAETSFYPALERLLSDVGKGLSPKVRCVINLANRGAGLPDGGLFSADQFRRKSRDAEAKENPFLAQNPSRGDGKPDPSVFSTEWNREGIRVGTAIGFFMHIAVFQRVDGKPANPEAGDLDLTVGWGHAGQGGVMPGKGKLIQRDDGAYDIFLSDGACWRNVPEAVWDFTIGGYQVIKKWLSYREKPLLGRGLTPEEVRYVTEMARRLAALIALQASLDDNYRNVIRTTYRFTSR